MTFLLKCDIIYSRIILSDFLRGFLVIPYLIKKGGFNMKNGNRVLDAVKKRVSASEKDTKVSRNMQYTNGAWNDSHRN